MQQIPLPTYYLQSLLLIVFIGLLLGFIPPAQVSMFIGEQSGIGDVLLVAVMGSFLHIPALIAFPLIASLLNAGATVATAAAFITTLTMVGMVTLPLEIREMGRKMALLRNNGISFCIAIMIAVLMELIL
ncbi:permease [Methanolobus halotolerans]|uniref:permease n=1 Tax=Methanolobus halotolerans TaxID=2052935 RepID=UPI00107F5A96|nr:permease [Methanolobus halotolerans]